MQSRSSATDIQTALTGPEPRRDDNGYLIIGNPEKGCPFCGSISVEASEVGKLAWYHPSTECCAQAVTRQIEWRSAELQGIQLERGADDRALAEQRRVAADSYGVKRSDAERRLRSMERGVDAKQEGYYGPRVKELAGEIARLKRVREKLGKPEEA